MIVYLVQHSRSLLVVHAISHQSAPHRVDTLVDSTGITMTMQFSSQTSDLGIILGLDCHQLTSSQVLHLRPS